MCVYLEMSPKTQTFKMTSSNIYKVGQKVTFINSIKSVILNSSYCFQNKHDIYISITLSKNDPRTTHRS